MEKKTLFSVGALLVLGLGAFFVMRAPEKGQRVGPKPRPIAPIKAAELAELDLTTEKQDHVVLVKKGGGWRLQGPQDWGADPQAAKALEGALEKLSFGDLVTEGVEKHGELGVLDGKATRVIAKNSSGAVVGDFYLGKSVGGFNMLRPAGKNEVWQSSGLVPYQVNRDAKGWRDHTIFDFQAADVDQLTVEAGADKLALEKLPAAKDAKPGEPAKWKIVSAEGDAPKTVEALDLMMVNTAAQMMSQLKAADFADDKKPEETGLDKPWVTVTARAKGTEHKLFVGASKGDDTFVRTGAGPTSWSLKKYAIDHIARKPIDFRDKTIVKAPAAEVTSIDITEDKETFSIANTAGAWKSAAHPTWDAGKLKGLAGAFENLQASGFADEKDPAKNGLAKPTGIAVVHKKDKSAITIKVGALKDATDYYVQKVGAPDVFLVKKFTVDRFLKKPADLTAAAAPAAPKK